MTIHPCSYSGLTEANEEARFCRAGVGTKEGSSPGRPYAIQTVPESTRCVLRNESDADGGRKEKLRVARFSTTKFVDLQEHP